MRRLPLIILVIGTGAFVSAQQTQQVERQKGLVQSLLNAEDKIESQAKRLTEWLGQLQKGKPLNPAQEVLILREVEDGLKPVPIMGGQLVPQLEQGELDQFQALSENQQKMLLDRAASVAQIEILAGETPLPRGTGFVVGKDLIATNCHVLALIARQLADGTWKLRSDVRAHFSDGADHDASTEFAITAIAAMPSTPGLDLALLRVSTVSLDGKSALPKGLALRPGKLVATWPPGKGMPIALVGYPRISTSTQSNLQQLNKLGRFAKLYSPGAVMEVSTIRDVDILNHIAGTDEGSSGSPIFSLDTFEVIGVHNCCTAAGAAPPASLPCAQILAAAAKRNHAIAASSILSNETLKPLF